MGLNLVTIIILVLSIPCIICSPIFCSNGSSQHLEGFITISNLVNDSYILWQRNSYAIYQYGRPTYYSQQISAIQTNGRTKLIQEHGLTGQAYAFPIDFDGYCVNVVEKLYLFNVPMDPRTLIPFTYYSTDGWQNLVNADISHQQIDILEVLAKEPNVFQLQLHTHDIRAILYFQSFGVLFIYGTTGSQLVFCSVEKGWQKKNKAIRWVGSTPDLREVDAGFVDNDNKTVYLFETQTISEITRWRTKYYKCSYNLKQSEVELECSDQKNISDMCSTFNWMFYIITGSVVVVVIVVLILIALLVIRCRRKGQENEIQTIDTKTSTPVATPDASS